MKSGTGRRRTCGDVGNTGCAQSPVSGEGLQHFREEDCGLQSLGHVHIRKIKTEKETLVAGAFSTVIVVVEVTTYNSVFGPDVSLDGNGPLGARFWQPIS